MSSIRVSRLIFGENTLILSIPTKAETAELATQMADDVPALFLYRPVYYLASDGSVSGVNMEGLAYPGDRYLRIRMELIFSLLFPYF